MSDSQPPPLPKRSRRASARRVLSTAFLTGFLVLALAASLLVCTGMVRWYSVPTGGMNPAIERGDLVLVERLTQRSRHPEHGDLVVFRTDEIYPNRESQVCIKRLAGLPGEELALSHGRLFANGQPVALRNRAGELSIQPPPGQSSRLLLSEEKTFTVPARACFVLGDNSAQSADSRVFGPVPEASLRGRAIWCLGPPGHFGRLR